MTQDSDFSNHWIADEGKVLTDGEVYSTDIWLGIYDTIEHWQEIDIPSDEHSDMPVIGPIDANYIISQLSNQKSSIADSELTMRATKDYTAGQYLYVNNKLLKATQNIANGSDIYIGVNAMETTIANELNALASLIE